jgi:LL-diaminopimelate aminotransferase
MKRNPHLAQLKGNYLFPEINVRKQQFLSKNPHAELISLGIGDTTEPITRSIVQSLIRASTGLGTSEGYSGYGPEQGIPVLRQKIASTLYSYGVKPEEVFISDGAKCDLGRLQMLFGSDISIAVQDPSYPVYVEGSVILGVKKVIPMPCTPENHFFPDLNHLPKTDLIYFCSPNNPTGAAASRAQLQELVQFAQANRSIIIFDSAYANYIQDPTLPKSIFEIEGAREVAIEIGSFSKLAGFTGIRLGWSIVCEELRYEDGSSVKGDWKRLITTVFNGASTLSQAGGCAALEELGLQEIAAVTKFYLENATLLRATLEDLGYEVFGGVNAPYLWVRFKGRQSWDLFQYFLDQFHLITTPGSGFGPQGEGFIRFTAFSRRPTLLKALSRLNGR